MAEDLADVKDEELDAVLREQVFALAADLDRIGTDQAKILAELVASLEPRREPRDKLALERLASVRNVAPSVPARSKRCTDSVMREGGEPRQNSNVN